MPTFDISSEYNQQEVVNAVDQAHREISNRYDFRDTGTFISYSENTITLKSSTSERMAAAEQVLKEKFAKRNVSIKFLGEYKDGICFTVIFLLISVVFSRFIFKKIKVKFNL